MRDERGIYYYAQPGNPKARVYVRKGPDGEIQFRLWYADHPEAWEKHGWLGHDVIRQAASMYQTERCQSADPLKLYDLALARSLLTLEEKA